MNAARKKYYQGEDISFDMNIKTNEGTIVDLSTIKEIVLYFYINEKKPLIKLTTDINKLSKGYLKLTISEDNNSVKAIIPSAITSNLECGNYTVEINIAANSSLVEDQRYNKIGKEHAFYLEQSEIRKES